MAVDEESDISQRSSTGGENTENKRNEGRGEEERAFECNICLDTAKDAVISMCGHLFWYNSKECFVSEDVFLISPCYGKLAVFASVA
jgi:hypothetical protein